MFELRCTVRNCQEILQRNERGLTCASGHHFDRAKAGYWSLLQPQDRRSLKPGDADDAVLARHRWLARGYGDSLITALRPWVSAEPARTVDLGCGEGSFAPSLFSHSADHYCGIDLSRKALKLAARGWPEATWCLANADRILPVADASVQCVVSLFGRRPISEIHRVLIPGGICIVTVPGEDDLIELREQVQRTGLLRSRWEAVASEMTNQAEDGLKTPDRGSDLMKLVEHKRWQQSIQLDRDAIADALAMTYRAGRHSEQLRLKSVKGMSVTTSADLMLFQKE